MKSACLYDLGLKLKHMMITETSPQQAEHFDWLNAIDFYHSYLDIIKSRLNALTESDSMGSIEQKVNYFSEKLNYLRECLGELNNRVSAHIEELEIEPAFDNRLDRTLQSSHHMGLREKFELYENEVSDFRTEFNKFYVRSI